MQPSIGIMRQLAVGIMVFHALLGSEIVMSRKSVSAPMVAGSSMKHYHAATVKSIESAAGSTRGSSEKQDTEQQQRGLLREMPFNPRNARRKLRRGMWRPNNAEPKKAEEQKPDEAAGEAATERKTQEETKEEVEKKEDEEEEDEKKKSESEDGEKNDKETTEKEEENNDEEDNETTEKKQEDKKKTEPSTEEDNSSADTDKEEDNKTTQDTEKEEETKAETKSEEKEESQEDETEAAPEPVEEKEENVSSRSVATELISNSVNEFNALEFSMTACEKLDMAVRFITSLDFEEHFERTFYAFYSSSESLSNDDNTDKDISTTRRTAGADTATFADAEAKFFAQVVMLQMILLPISIAFLLLGGVFFYPACILCAAAIGLLGVFDVIEGVLPIKLDCPMKLSLSIVAAFLSAVLAVSFFRFGLFCFGSVSIGGITYLLMDSFPQYLDPGVVVFQTAETSSALLKSVSKDLSTPGWVLICCCSIAGGMVLRLYEQATLELLTAALGGVGCAYSVHSLLLVRRYSLDPSFVFLLAFFLGVTGWRIQRHRRLKAYNQYYVPRRGVSPEQLPTTNQDSAAWMAAQQQQQIQLQQQMQQLLMQGPATDRAGVPTSDQISELTSSINRFLQVVEKGQKGDEGTKSGRDAKDE